jgi:hypothetical protein
MTSGELVPKRTRTHKKGYEFSRRIRTWVRERTRTHEHLGTSSPERNYLIEKWVRVLLAKFITIESSPGRIYPIEMWVRVLLNESIL